MRNKTKKNFPENSDRKTHRQRDIQAHRHRDKKHKHRDKGTSRHTESQKTGEGRQ